MNMKLSLTAAALAAGILLGTLPGLAAGIGPLGAIKDLGAGQSTVEQAHFWHRKCRRGLNGWHKHVPGVGRVQCTNHVCRHGKCFWY